MGALESELQKRVEDIVREELLTLGWDYDETIAEITDEGAGEGCQIRFQGNRPDLELSFADTALDEEALRARISRRLRVALEGPNPFAEPIDAGEI